jgi:hypothetical protein
MWPKIIKIAPIKWRGEKKGGSSFRKMFGEVSSSFTSSVFVSHQSLNR